MTARKSLDPECDGSILCTVSNHTFVRHYLNGKMTFLHISLTKGQRKTLSERRRKVSSNE